MYAKFLKRLFDFLIALCAVICLLPVLVVLIVLGAVKMKGNPFFTQDRPGKDEKIFKLIKFRTMTCEKDENGELLPDELRLTKYGKFLRSTSLDELPELFNIIKGDMSFIGPRPLLVDYLPFYTEKERKRHSVRPGLSGLAQVNGRSFISWEEIFELDVTYTEKISLKLDLILLIKTFLKVLKRDDVASVSDIEQDENGELYVLVDGAKVRLHRPLHIEREGKAIAE